MSVEVEVDQRAIDQLANKFRKYNDGINDKQLVEMIAERVKSNIFTRTQAGYDTDYKTFLPYNPKYAEKEGKTIVNLTLTGQMMNEMTQVALDNNTAKIFFMTERSRTLADKHNNIGVGRQRKIRKFFGINIRDEADAQKLFKEEMARVKETSGL